MTETKRDVFEELLEIAGNAMDQAMSAQYPSDENGCAPSGIGKAIRDILDPIEKRYDAALPDDLPVIPKRISKIIRILKSIKMDITQALMYIRSELNSYTDWSLLDNNSEIFARAWVLGAWKVEETGEIVKLEAEK